MMPVKKRPAPIKDVLPESGPAQRALERLAEEKDFQRSVYVLERIRGQSSFEHSLCYCQGVEELMGLQVPERAKYLRVVWAELSRLQNHALWLATLSGSLGFSNLALKCWVLREQVVDILEAAAGSRVIFSVNRVGGVRRDIDEALKTYVLASLEKIETELMPMKVLFFDDCGEQTVSSAMGEGETGPGLRAWGTAVDLRSTGYAAYSELNFEPVIESAGDICAQMNVRFRECHQSVDLIRQALDKMPEGPLCVSAEGLPEGEILSRIEAPEGELAYFIKADGTLRLSRIHFHESTAVHPQRQADDAGGDGGGGSLDSLLDQLFSKPVTGKCSAKSHTFGGLVRGSIKCAIEQCVFCGKCAACCPAGALAVSETGKTWSINPFRCVLCGECTEVCPEKALGFSAQCENEVKE